MFPFAMMLALLVATPKASAGDYYTAAVVEYTTPRTTLPADQNMMSNAAVYSEFMANASKELVDIIVFPEGGLCGHANFNKYIELPPPNEDIAPCDLNSTYHPALVRLSCAARESNIYVVINLSEKYVNVITNKTELYNSNVVFNRNGAVIGRYRKYNPYGEPVNKPSEPDHQTFQTDFGVSFGMFICFDIEFLEPAIVMARQFGIKHFVFPHCWISELPFLTAIQAQWGWAYSLDVVLLAAGCNRPDQGGSGSGIYSGRQGALTAFQTETRTSEMLIAKIPKTNNAGTQDFKNSRYSEPKHQKWPSLPLNYNVQFMGTVIGGREEDKERDSSSRLAMLRDYMEVYSTVSLNPSTCPSQVSSTNSTFKITETIEKTVCQDSFCCDFQINVTSLFSSTPSQKPIRGDDFSQFHYRLAVFDGVRWYGGGLATGGIQLCGVVPCVNESISSCGLRADDPTGQPEIVDDTFGPLYKIGTVFESISVTGKFTYNNSFIYPDIFVTGTSDSYGALVSSEQFSYHCSDHDNSTLCSLKTTAPLPNVITATLYSRQFDRDGQQRTELSRSYADHQNYNLLVIATLFFIIFQIIV